MEVSAKKKNRIFIILMTVMLVIQLLLLFVYGTRKAGFHEDELYTYYSTNKTAGLFVNDREWMTRDQLRNDFIVLPGEQFRYGVVKQMQSWDVHPPLYYYMIHTVSSLFPGVFNKWIGIGVNLLAFILCYYLLGKCAYELFSRTDAQNQGNAERMTFLTCLAWGFSSAVISGVMFIRMYQWLTFFILLCAFLHIRAMKKNDFRISRFYLPLAITVFCGFMTQYYYVIFHFFMGFGFCIYLLSKKKWKELITYVFSCAVGLAAAIAYYPASLSHIFRGYRGTEAVSEFGNAGNTWERLRFFGGLFDEYVMNGTLTWWLLLLCLIAVTVFYLNKRKNNKKLKISSVSALLLFSCTGYFFTVSKTALLLGETSNRYELPIYGLILLLLILATVYFVSELWGNICHKPFACINCNQFLTIFLAAVFAVMNLTAMLGNKVFFLYEEEKPIMEFVKANTDTPVIVFYNEASSDNIWWLSDELMEYPKVYLASQGNRDTIKEKAFLESSHVVAYVADYDQKEECTKKLMEQNPNLKECREIGQKGLWTIYELN